MAMNVMYSVSCDKCKTIHVGSYSARAARWGAKAHGWVRIRARPNYIDLCPLCKAEGGRLPRFGTDGGTATQETYARKE